MKVVSVVGMTGAGKSEVSRVFEQNGFTLIRFGDLTDQEMKRRGLKPNEASERLVREKLRREHGPAAYAELNQPRIEQALKNTNVVIDGLYSWEEYTCLKSCYGNDLYLVAVWSSPATRYARLADRNSRGLTEEEARRKNRPIEVQRFPWKFSGRATTMGAPEGLTKIIIDPETQRILGVGICGRDTEGLISEGVLAIEMGALAEDMALSIHPHPTLSETEGEAAEIFLGTATHILGKSKTN